MLTYTIEQWDETCSIVAETRGDADPTDLVVAALHASPHDTVMVEIEDNRNGKLLIASRGRWGIVAWVEPGDRILQLITDGGPREGLEMHFHGEETHLAGTELVSLADAELAIRELLTTGRGSLGLPWVEK